MTGTQVKTDSEKMGFGAIRDYLSQYQSFLLITHRSPDGDALGSLLGMAHYLKGLGKQLTLVDQDPVPRRLRHLPGSDWVKTPEDLKGGPDYPFEAVITLDAADERQLGTALALIPSGIPLLNIDHHVTNSNYGTVNLIDANAASATQIVYNYLRHEKAELTYDISVCLYTGLVTDTGGFSYSNTTKEVHLMAADLLAQGIDPFEVAERVLLSRTSSQLRLTQEVLKTLEVDESGQFAWAVVTQELMNRVGASEDDSEALIEYPRSIETVEVAVLFKEREAGLVKVSLRSKFRVDVSQIALAFGGGGHKRAAGCSVEAPLSEAVAAVLNEIKKEI